MVILIFFLAIPTLNTDSVHPPPVLLIPITFLCPSRVCLCLVFFPAATPRHAPLVFLAARPNDDLDAPQPASPPKDSRVVASPSFIPTGCHVRSTSPSDTCSAPSPTGPCSLRSPCTPRRQHASFNRAALRLPLPPEPQSLVRRPARPRQAAACRPHHWCVGHRRQPARLPLPRPQRLVFCRRGYLEQCRSAEGRQPRFQPPRRRRFCPPPPGALAQPVAWSRVVVERAVQRPKDGASWHPMAACGPRPRVQPHWHRRRDNCHLGAPFSLLGRATNRRRLRTTTSSSA